MAMASADQRSVWSCRAVNAAVNCPTVGSYPRCADAHLISAAPDILAALRDLAEAADGISE
ncbi:MAG: hypothetical protein ACLP0B_08330 [Steroidobacteraceae bacterium]